MRYLWQADPSCAHHASSCHAPSTTHGGCCCRRQQLSQGPGSKQGGPSTKGIPLALHWPHQCKEALPAPSPPGPATTQPGQQQVTPTDTPVSSCCSSTNSLLHPQPGLVSSTEWVPWRTRGRSGQQPASLAGLPRTSSADTVQHPLSTMSAAAHRQGSISYSGSSVSDTLIVSPSPSINREPMPMALFSLPSSPSPACSGGVASA